jgi:hypothetical protein
VMSDANPDGSTAWAQYAQADNKKHRDAAATARTTSVLHNTLMQVSSAVVRRPGASPANYGTDVHTTFARTVRTLNLPGIGETGVEQSFDARARHGTERTAAFGPTSCCGTRRGRSLRSMI